MTALVVVLALVAAVAAGVALRRRTRRRKSHPIEHRRTIDFDELRAMWPGDIGGYE